MDTALRPVALVTGTRPFGPVTRVAIAPGATLAEMLVAAGVPDSELDRITVAIGNWPVERRLWHRVRPKPGQIVTVLVVPGSGGGGDKNPLATILSIAVMVAAMVVFPYLAPMIGTVGAALASAAITMAGSLLISAIAPPPRSGNPGLGWGGQGPDASRAYSLRANNSLTPYAPVPLVLGRHRWYPPYGAQPYTEFGDDGEQYLVMMFHLGYGPLALSDLMIGDTPITLFEGIQTELRHGYGTDGPLTLYHWDTTQEDFAITLDAPVTRRAGNDAHELAVDIIAPQGLVHFSDDGSRSSVTVPLHIEYAPAGGSLFTTAFSVQLSANQTKPVRRSFRWAVAEGSYDVRVTRTNAASGSSRTFDLVQWTALRTIRHRDPVAMPGIAKVAIRLRASERLSGVVDRFNCIATRGDRNPATAYRLLLQGAWLDPADRAADTDFDTTTLDSWAADCTARGYTFDAVVDFETTVRDLLGDICAAGRASFHIRDGRYSVIQDRPNTVPIQLFTPRNSWGFRSRKLIADLPHALRVRFINPDLGWQRDEILVYADGATPGSATRFEVIDLFGITDWRLAWKHGRYHTATAALRTELVELSADVEHLVCTRGDLVLVAHDVLRRGLGWGRVTAVTGARVSVDEVVQLEGGPTFLLVHRSADGTIRTVPIAAAEGHLITLAEALSAIAVGDLVAWGVAGAETRRMLVKAIEPGPDLSARLILVDEAPAVHDADANPPTTHASGLPIPDPSLPPLPALDRPTALRATGSFGTNVLTWTNPDTTFDWIEVWVSETASRDTAALIGTVAGETWTHGGLAAEVTRWYWVRAIRGTTPGPWNADAGTVATTRRVTFGDLEAQFIRETHLIPELQRKILSIDQLAAAFTTLAETVTATEESIATVRKDVQSVATAQSATAAAVETIETTVGDHTASVQTLSQTVDGLQAATFTKVQLETHGGSTYVAGFGLEAHVDDNGQPVSAFGVLVDRFFVGMPGQDGGSPRLPFFIYRDAAGQPRIALDSVFIHEASIDTLKVKDGAIVNATLIDGTVGGIYCPYQTRLLIIAHAAVWLDKSTYSVGMNLDGARVRNIGGYSAGYVPNTLYYSAAVGPGQHTVQLSASTTILNPQILLTEIRR